MQTPESVTARRQFGIELEAGPLHGPISAACIARLRDAAHDHGFVVLRDQRLTDQELLDLGRCFGTIEDRVIKYSTVGPSKSQYPSLWHHHNCCDGALDDWILYYTPAIPDAGGTIEFFDAASWFTRLDGETRAWAMQQRVRHDYTPVVHAGIPPIADPPWHPLVITRDSPGRQQKALYAAAHAMEMTGLPDITKPQPGSPWHKAATLAQSPDLRHLHQARTHDLILWDMKMVAHRGYPWASRSLRVVHEVIIRRIFQ